MGKVEMLEVGAIRVLIVDDEPHARRRIKQLLKRERGFEIVGEEGDGTDAVSAIKQIQPDVVFLDIQMPELDGFGVVKKVGPRAMPYVVFVTAYEEYALRAFDVHAFDYLLKPFSQSRFSETIRRVRAEISNRDDRLRGLSLERLMRDLRNDWSQEQRLTIKSGGRIFFVKSSEISRIEASGNYVVLHIGGREHLVRHTLTNFHSLLSGENFIRVHRSRIVNVDHAREIRSEPDGSHCIVMKDGACLPVSRKYYGKLVDLL
jgi:two-component system LytT family response regulator